MRTLLFALVASLGSPAIATAAVDCGIFVAPDGIDDVDCGADPSDPCATVNKGIERAVAEAATCVFIQAGTYSEVVALASGVDLIGGFDADWNSDVYTAAGHTVVLVGGFDPGSDQYLTLSGLNLSTETTVTNLVIEAPDASGSMFDSGRSSYGVYLNDCSGNVVLESMRILGGNGAPGAPGADGPDAASVAATGGMNGGPGGSSGSISTNCDITTRGAGGAPGNNGGATQGGAGGNGGTMDTSCNFFGCDDCSATPGSPGANAVVNSGILGDGGSGGAPCGAGGNGTDGQVFNGAPGPGGSGGGLLLADFWYAKPGTAGGLGSNGGGGGGGGGSGGCDTGVDDYGAGGGGGGAGGLAALGGGAGGSGGGGSFCVFAVNSVVSVLNCDLVRGDGGLGGQGGSGGRGQDPGLGGNGGAATGDALAGGDGGDGGHGGHGGGGGGGAGGDSYAIRTFSCILNQLGNTVSGGAAGAGGPGGVSAPGAPPPYDDGNDGMSGSSGTLATVLSSSPQPTPLPASIALQTPAATTCDPTPCLQQVAVPDPGGAPEHLALSLSRNPARGSTLVQLALPSPGEIEVRVHDVSGRLVSTLAAGSYPAGRHGFNWSTRDVAPGVYWVRARTPSGVVGRQVIALE